MDSRLAAVPVVTGFAAAVESMVAGLYVAGSVATRDYRPGVSDIDAVALVAEPLRPAHRSELVAIHEQLVRDVEGAGALHCVYVPREQVADATRKHWTWAFDELFRRPFSGIARAELLADPVVVAGPAPATWLPPMDADELRAAARAELAGYWTRALRKRKIWLQDVYVDIGLTVVARADATIKDGRLITKTEAISRMTKLGVPHDVVEGVASRRQGRQVAMTDGQRQDRALVVRGFLSAEIARLLAPASPS